VTFKTGVESLPREEPGGSLLTGQVGVRHEWWRERGSGSCAELGNLSPRWDGWPVALSGLRLVVWSENPKQQICEGESSDAGHRGGPDRSSCEGPVMGLERRGRVVLAGFQANRGDAGGVA
jgi:hypothetical protein